MVSILNILMRQFVVHRLLMPIGALCPAVALPLHKERAYVWPIPLIIRVRSRKLLQHLPPNRRRPIHIQPRFNSTITSILHLGLHILRIVLTVDVGCRCFIFVAQSSVTDLSGETVFEIEETSLADVFDFGAGLADDGCFESGALAGVPAEHGEGTCAGATGATIFLFGLGGVVGKGLGERGESYVRTIRMKGLGPRPARSGLVSVNSGKMRSHTCFTKDGEVALFPAGLVNISFRHVCWCPG